MNMAEYTHPLGTGLSADQTIVRAYDETNNRHRVDAQVTAVIGAVDVVIDAASGDNIAIRDSDGDELAVNVDGSINVVVQDITLDYTNDSVTAYQGTNPWIVSATDLDIRNLTFAQDKVDVSGSSVSVSNFPFVQDVNILAAVEIEVKNDVGNPLSVSGTVELGATTLAALESVTVQNPAGAGAVNIQDGGNSITVDGTVSAVQSGTWNINDITGTVSLPTGAATSTNQTSGAQKTQITDAAGVPATLKPLNVQITATDVGVVTNTVIHGLTTGGGGGYVDVKVTPSGALAVEATQGTSPWVTSTTNGALQTTQASVLAELVAANSSLDAIQTDAESIRLETVAINSELDAQTTLLTSIDQSTNDIESATESLDLKFDVNLSTRNTEATQQLILTELQSLNTSTDNIEADTDAIRIAVQSLDADFDVALSTRATEATQLNNRTELQNINTELDAQTALLTTINQSADDIETATESLNTKFDVNLSTRASEATLASVDSKLNSLGQKTMAGSVPVVIASDQSTINVNTEGVVVAQTTANLGIAGVYTSASIDTKDFGTIIVSSFANVAGSFTVEWSIDQVTWRSDGDTYTTVANVLKTSTYGPKFRYVRGVYTNGGTAQTTFEFQIVLKRNHTKPSSHKASEAFNDSTDLEGVKAVVAGKAPNGTYVNWAMTNGGSGKISLAEFESSVSQNNQLLTADILTTNTGVQSALTVGTSAVEVKVGGSALANRKEVTLYNNSATVIYWGRNSGVTTTNGTPIMPQELMVWKKGPSSPIFVIASVASQNTRITEDA